MLVTRPRHDRGTNYLFYWSQNVVSLAKEKSIRVLDLAAQKATKLLLHQYCQKFKPTFFFLNGHGSTDVVTGHNNEPLLTADEDLSIVSASIVYCRSCEVAVMLGQAVVQAGAQGFIGYRRKFILAYLPEYISKPLVDPLAKLFLEPSNLIPITLLKGHDLGEAYRRSLVAMHKNMSRMLSSAASFEERYHAQFLWSNIRSQTILGNPDARI